MYIAKRIHDQLHYSDGVAFLPNTSPVREGALWYDLIPVLF